MKFSAQFLVFFSLVMFGCATKLDSTHAPPKKSGGYKGDYSLPGSKKMPATQRPYRIKGVKYTPIPSAAGFVQSGRASWYGKKFHGRKTSNGEIYNMYAMTAAHKTLPMNTWVRVHNLENNKKIVVRINDRGPFIAGRIIDLSYTGARRLDIVRPGTARVRVTALGRATSYSKKTKDPVAFKPVDYWKGNFTVQVGAFKQRQNAEKYRDRLSRSYDNAHIETFSDDRGTFFRVRIGRFTNLNKAASFSETLMKRKGFKSAFAVAE